MIVEDRKVPVYETMTLQKLEAPELAPAPSSSSSSSFLYSSSISSSRSRSSFASLSAIDDVKQQMMCNIESVLTRGEKIELLSERTNDLSANAYHFKKSATSLRRRMWWNKLKLWV